jgi:hypothetical protein
LLCSEFGFGGFAAKLAEFTASPASRHVKGGPKLCAELSTPTNAPVPPAALPAPLPVGFDSLIVSDFPRIFMEFHGKDFSLL